MGIPWREDYSEQLRKIATMRAFLGVALIISLMVMESNAASNELTCTICVDIVTEIDNWITSDKTEEQILNFFNEICLAVDQLFPGLGATCTDFLFNLALELSTAWLTR